MNARKIIFLTVLLLSFLLSNASANANPSLRESPSGVQSSQKNRQIFKYKAIKNPAAMAVNSKNEIFIAGGRKNRYEIAVFNMDGKRLKTFIFGLVNHGEGGISGISRNVKVYNDKGVVKPWSIFIGKNGNLWVANEGGKRGFISKISPEGKVLLKITKEIDFPYSIAFTKNGNIIVANYGNGFDGYLSEYNKKGIFLRKFTKGIENPYSVITGNNGNIYAANYNKGNIVCLSKSGKILWTSYEGISYPYSILLGKNGNIWVINDGPVQGSIDKYDPRGKLFKNITFGISYPYGAAVDKAGNVFVANFNNDTVSEFNESGKFIGFAGNIRKPIGITVTGTGDIITLNDDGYFTKITVNVNKIPKKGLIE
ncbi:MAG: NHL repeat-containing protein [Deltaproteobacteria bacterium]|jgi:streptogramin lyase|nr:NHL repeat-containing protein [Deltaproteobacteria bacterium]